MTNLFRIFILFAFSIVSQSQSIDINSCHKNIVSHIKNRPILYGASTLASALIFHLGILGYLINKERSFPRSPLPSVYSNQKYLDIVSNSDEERFSALQEIISSPYVPIEKKFNYLRITAYDRADTIRFLSLTLMETLPLTPSIRDEFIISVIELLKDPNPIIREKAKKVLKKQKLIPIALSSISQLTKKLQDSPYPPEREVLRLVINELSSLENSNY